MILSVMQPYIFPYIGYWQLLHVSNKFVIFDDVNFIKKGYINRNSILVGGKSQRFNLLLKGVSQNILINEIEVNDSSEKLLKTIYLNYKKSPQFNSVYPIVEDILKNSEKNLAKFLGYSISQISQYMNIDSDIVYSSEIVKDDNLKSQDKIIDICNRLQATQYVNAIGGQDLYNREVFKENSIKLNFIKTNIIEYKQFNNEFVPYLSIIDIMMFNEVDKITDMLNSYELI